MRRLRNIFFGLSLLLLVGGIGYRIGENRASHPPLRKEVVLVGTTPPPDRIDALSSSQVDFSLFWQVWRRLAEKYIDKLALDPTKMVYGAISGMVSSLDDPYTVFLAPAENKEAKEELGGKFEGIGAQLGMEEKRIMVIAPLSNTPAEKAGIRAGDFIVKVDGQETAGWSLPKAVSRIRGPRGTTVTLTMLHDGEEKTVDIAIVRDTIKVVSVEWEIKNVKCLSRAQSRDQMSPNQTGSNVKCEVVKDECSDCFGVFYLRLSRFGDNTKIEWEKAVAQISSQNCVTTNDRCRGIVFDLRNNPGGYLEGSVFTASEFLDGGTVVIQEDSDGSKQSFVVNRQGKLTKSPLVVLINKGSASASEIVAGSLKINKRAQLVGEKTFGKGTVQETEELAGGAGLYITVARWLLPDGSSLAGQGVEPDVIIEPLKDEKDRDVQLEKAIEVLVGNL